MEMKDVNFCPHCGDVDWITVDKQKDYIADKDYHYVKCGKCGWKSVTYIVERGR